MKTKNNLIDVYVHYYTKDDKWWNEKRIAEFKKTIFDVFRTESGALVAVNECRGLETHFWISEGQARSYGEALQICHDIRNNKEDHFIAENCSAIDNTIEYLDRYINLLKDREKYGVDDSVQSLYDCSEVFYIYPLRRDLPDLNPIREIGCWDGAPDKEAITLKDALTYKDILLRQREKQEKRCKTYLKKYGTKHIYASVFWDEA